MGGIYGESPALTKRRMMLLTACAVPTISSKLGSVGIVVSEKSVCDRQTSRQTTDFNNLIFLIFYFRFNKTLPAPKCIPADLFWAPNSHEIWPQHVIFFTYRPFNNFKHNLWDKIPSFLRLRESSSFLTLQMSKKCVKNIWLKASLAKFSNSPE